MNMTKKEIEVLRDKFFNECTANCLLNKSAKVVNEEIEEMNNTIENLKEKWLRNRVWHYDVEQKLNNTKQ